MPAERVSMRRIREILRGKYEDGATERAIARTIGVARSTVALTLERVTAVQLGWPLPAGLSDAVLEAMLYAGAGRPQGSRGKAEPDWTHVPPRCNMRPGLIHRPGDRYGRGATLITSQIPVDRWHDLIGEPTLAERHPRQDHSQCPSPPAQGRQFATMRRLQFFHPRRHVERPDGREREPASFAPGEKPAAGPRIGPACVIVVDVGGEELDVAPAGLVAAGIGNEGRHYIGVGRRRGRERGGWDDGGELVVGGCHDPFPTTILDSDKGRCTKPLRGSSLI